MADNLASKTCVPCKIGTAPLQGVEIARLLDRLGSGWQVVDGHHLRKEYRFENFRQALEFTNKVGEIAEEQGHHPDLHLSWGKLDVLVWTHKIDGLTESDFVFAAKVDAGKTGKAD
jgi:4a-hydroxytetrahydrobiopterin dehydratase